VTLKRKGEIDLSADMVDLLANRSSEPGINRGGLIDALGQ